MTRPIRVWKHGVVTVSVLATAFFGESNAVADSCTYITTGDQGDNFYMNGTSGWHCQQAFVDWWWNEFDFDQGDWDEGFGYDDPCNNAKPLARTFNGLFALGYSHTQSPHCNTSSLIVADWAMCWAASKTDELDGKCGSGSASGTGATA